MTRANPKPVDISVERRIRCGRARLAAYCADMSNAPTWYRNIASVEWQSEPSSGIGARAAFVAHFIGRRMAYTYEIVEHVPGERLVMSTLQGPFPMTTIYEWQDAGRRTRMRLTNRGAPSGFKALLMPLMALAMRRAMSQDLRELDGLMSRQKG